MKNRYPRLRQFCLAATLVFSIAIATAAQGTWVMENRSYHDPLRAEPRAAQISITAIAISDELPFVQEPGKRPVWDISLGKEIPIVGYETGDGKGKPLGKGKWGIGFWLPVSFHMIEDFKDPSSPILNTDYRFGGAVKAQYGLTKHSRLGGRIQVGHESTHLGDEFSLAARRTKPDFERVNVSYEYWEYNVSFETDQGKQRLHRLVFRHGGIGLINSKKGFYSPESLEPDGRTIARSARNFEPYLGFEWLLQRGLFMGLGPFASVDVRFRTIYDYQKASDLEREDSQPSINLLLGLRFKADRKPEDKGIPELFFRYYHGVNPAGQFRNQKNYQLIGFGIYVPI
ncbi:MAG TPA: DUF1207 domain-containing protein [Pyrinomonadaceae bacterium]|nr:DUF1207 domain-containing protein [Pyrinomonadaceae bacterium]